MCDNISPINTRKGEDMNWEEEDDKRVLVLRNWLRKRVMVKVRTTEEIVGDGPQLQDGVIQQVGGMAGDEGGGWDLLMWSVGSTADTTHSQRRSLGTTSTS